MSQTMEKHFSSPAFQKAVDQQRKEVKGRKITMAEVAQHKGMMDMWIVVRGQVFDCTKYASSHPGGRLTILRNAGGDATKPFDAEGHSFEAVMKLAKLFIGDLVEQSEEAAEAAAAAEAEKLAQEAATAQRARQLQEESARKQAQELQARQRAEEEARQAKAAAEAQAQAQAQAQEQRKREQAALLLAQQQKQAAEAEAQRRHDEAAIHAQRQAALRQAQEMQRQAAQQQDALDQKNKADLEAGVIKSAATAPSLQISSVLSNAPDFDDEDDECGTPNAVQLMRALSLRNNQVSSPTRSAASSILRRGNSSNGSISSPITNPGSLMRMWSRNSPVGTCASDDASPSKVDTNNNNNNNNNNNYSNNVAQAAKASSASKLMQSEWPSAASAGSLADSLPTKNNDMGGDMMATCVEEDVSTPTGSANRMQFEAALAAPVAEGKLAGDARLLPTVSPIDRGNEGEAVGQLPTIASASVTSFDGSNYPVSPISQSTLNPRAAVVGSNEGVTHAEVAKHNTPDDAWVVLDGVVYDLTRYMANHPGGSKVIMEGAGRDCTEEWRSIHPNGLDQVLKGYRVGKLVGKDGDAGHPLAVHPVGSSKAVECAFADEQTVECTVETKVVTSRNCFEMRLRLPSDKQARGLKVGGHIVLSTEHGGKKINRAYTPIRSNFADGHFDLLIKVYQPCSKFPSGGIMTQYLDSLSPGDKVPVRAGGGEFSYLGRGHYRIDDNTKKAARIGFLAAGSGITPALQVIKAILDDPDDETECWLLYSNQTERDIMARDMIEEMLNLHPKRFIRYYTLTGCDKPEGWGFGMGRISDWMMTLLMPKPDNQTLITLCGPAGFCYETCLPLLESVGHGVSVKHVF